MRKNNLNINKRILYSFYAILFLKLVFTQNSLVGDGFGGRLWYNPTNYTVGSYSGYSICYDNGCSNGSNQLYGWGSNNYSQLGYSTTTTTGVITPTAIPNMSNVKYFSTGYAMGAVKNDDSGWAWGIGVSPTPTQVITNAKFLDASSTTVSFIKHDGTIWSVGSNSNGNFGDGTTTSSSIVPSQMSNINNAVRVANNSLVTIILLSDGTVKSVGINTSGLLGVGTSSIYSSYIPITINGLSNIIDIKATWKSVIALDKYGDVYTWGMGEFIGDGDNSDEYSPKKITTLSNIIAISGCDDGASFMALDANKNCYTWGQNITGQQIAGTTPYYLLTPTLVANNVIDIMAGETFAYIVKADGSLWCSGFSYGGSIWLNLTNQLRTNFTQLNPTLVAGACNVISTIANTTPSCGNNNGSIVISQTGGQAPYLYNIGNGTQTSNMFSGLTAGSYTVLITDSNSCATVITCDVDSSVGVSPIINVNNPTICAGTPALITATGATNYSWSNSSTTGATVVVSPSVTTVYTVTGTDSSECAGANSFTVSVIEIPTINTATNSVCIGNSIVLTTNAITSNTWLPSTTLNTPYGSSVIATPNSTTIYTLQSISGLCAFTSTIQITVDTNFPNANFADVSDQTLIVGSNLQLNNQSTNYNNLKWQLCDNTISTNNNLFFILPEAGNCCIKLTAYNNTCMDSITKCINVAEEIYIKIPNVFTPNEDGVNDLFKINTKGIKTLHCEIYNRWGQKLYEWHDINGFWDGKTKTGAAPEGTYFYIVNYSDNENNSKTDKGFLTLFRE